MAPEGPTTRHLASADLTAMRAAGRWATAATAQHRRPRGLGRCIRPVSRPIARPVSPLPRPRQSSPPCPPTRALVRIPALTCRAPTTPAPADGARRPHHARTTSTFRGITRPHWTASTFNKCLPTATDRARCTGVVLAAGNGRRLTRRHARAGATEWNGPSREALLPFPAATQVPRSRRHWLGAAVARDALTKNAKPPLSGLGPSRRTRASLPLALLGLACFLAGNVRCARRNVGVANYVQIVVRAAWRWGLRGARTHELVGS